MPITKIIPADPVITNNLFVDKITDFLNTYNYRIKAVYLFYKKQQLKNVVWVFELNSKISFISKTFVFCEYCDDIIFKIDTEPFYNVLAYLMTHYYKDPEEVAKEINGFTKKVIYTSDTQYATLL